MQSVHQYISSYNVHLAYSFSLPYSIQSQEAPHFHSGAPAYALPGSRTDANLMFVWADVSSRGRYEVRYGWVVEYKSEDQAVV